MNLCLLVKIDDLVCKLSLWYQAAVLTREAYLARAQVFSHHQHVPFDIEAEFVAQLRRAFRALGWSALSAFSKIITAR